MLIRSIGSQQFYVSGIKTCSMNFNQNLTSAGKGDGCIFKLYDFGATALMNFDGFHLFYFNVLPN